MNRATLAFIVFMVIAVAVLGFTADRTPGQKKPARKR